jgi:phosphoribosylaminoimidazole carboxylase (NCAIR synthetase)
LQRGDIEVTRNRDVPGRRVRIKQSLCQLQDQTINGKRFAATRKGICDGFGQFRVRDHRGPHERQRASVTTQHLYGFENQLRFDVELSISETRFRSRVTIMDLIGV